jgi:hypothetical protein
MHGLRNRTVGIVGPGSIGNGGDGRQGGGCWAFSVTENVESMWAIAGHPLEKLSMQQLVDCDTNDNGCNGGMPENAFRWIISNGGLDSYSSYPYHASKSRCAAPKNPVARISSFGFITTNDNEQHHNSQTVAPAKHWLQLIDNAEPLTASSALTTKDPPVHSPSFYQTTIQKKCVECVGYSK